MKSIIQSFDSAKQFLQENGHKKGLCKISEGNEDDLSYLQNHYDLIIIARALKLEYSIKQGLSHIWTPDWNDGKPKYFCYFDMRGSGSGFADSDYHGWSTHTHVGSRLCFPTEDLAKYFGQNFTDKHKVAMFEPKGWPVGGQEISAEGSKVDFDLIETAFKKYNEQSDLSPSQIQLWQFIKTKIGGLKS